MGGSVIGGSTVLPTLNMISVSLVPRLSKKESPVLTACACVKNPSIPGFPYNFGTLSVSWMGSDVMFRYSAPLPSSVKAPFRSLYTVWITVTSF